jgi:hypothetical protein
MKYSSTAVAGVLASTLILIAPLQAEEVRAESFPSNRLLADQVLLHIPAGKPAGLLVLLPAGDIRSYDEQSGYTPATLPRLLSTNGVMTLVVAARPGLGAGVGLYAGDAVLDEIHEVIAKVLDSYKIQNGKVAMGGFSAGGIGAMRYAQFCIRRGDRKTKTPVAAFAVDSPLDYERWFLSAELALKRLALAERENAEDRDAVYYLRKEFGASPADAAEAYRRQSVVSALVPAGGNARLLKDTPVRIYIEPDVKWRVENWNQDIYNSNVVDATALINVLRLLGNKDAELIVTSGRGYRRDGSRNPHSWSIVDERDLAQWLTKMLAPRLEK